MLLHLGSIAIEVLKHSYFLIKRIHQIFGDGIAGTFSLYKKGWDIILRAHARGAPYGLGGF
jgi:hypothetical protein